MNNNIDHNNKTAVMNFMTKGIKHDAFNMLTYREESSNPARSR